MNAPAGLDEVAAPYRGILPFGYRDRAIFFARNEEIHLLASLVTIHRGVMLYGDAGTGKSSLLNAGLAPEALRVGLTPVWLRVQPRVGAELVLDSGYDSSRMPSPTSGHQPEHGLASGVLDVSSFEGRVASACDGHRPPLLIFDQFEELVTLFDVAAGAASQSRIVELIVGLLDGPLPIKIVLSFREDYLGRVNELLASCPELSDQVLRVAPPGADALRTIVRGPFDLYPGHFQPELAPSLCDELIAALLTRFGAGEVSLSEVQTICLRLWQSEDPKALLDREGPQGILEGYLGEALEGMPGAMQNAAIALLAQMITVAGTRNVISAEDLIARVRAEDRDVESQLLASALDHLSNSRLVRREHRRDLELYEITSEFLVPWIRERRDELRRVQERRRYRRRLVIVTSVAAALSLVVMLVAALAAWALTQRADARRQARRATSLTLATDAEIAGASGRLDAALLLSLAALRPYHGTLDSPAIARSSMIAALETAQLSGVEGVLHGADGITTSVAYSPSGRLIATGSSDGTVHIWDAATHRQLHALPTSAANVIFDVAFSSDGRMVAAAGFDGRAWVWDASTGRQVGRPLGTGRDALFSLAFAPGTGQLLTAGRDGLIRFWNVASGREFGRPLQAAGSVYGISVGTRAPVLAAAASTGTIDLWNLATRRALRPLRTDGAGVRSLSLSPNGKLLVAGDSGGIVRVWRLAGRRLIDRWSTGTGQPIQGVGFAPGARVVAATGDDGTVRVWNVVTHHKVSELATSSGDPLEGLDFSPERGALAAAAYNGTVWIWNLAARRRSPVDLRAGSGPVNSVAFGRTRDVLATGGADGTVWLWNPSTGAHRALAPIGHYAPIRSVALNRAGTIVAAGSVAGQVIVWHPKMGATSGAYVTVSKRPVLSVAFSPRRDLLAAGTAGGTIELRNASTLAPVEKSLRATNAGINSVAFSPNGRTLATGGADGFVRLWDVARGTQTAALPTAPGNAIASVAFSPNGRVLGAGGLDGTTLWSIPSDRQLKRLTANASDINSITFSPNGGIYATGSQVGSVRIWDLATNTLLGTPMSANEGPVNSVAFSPDGRTIAAGYGDGGARLWSGVLWPSFARLVRRVCALTGGELGRAEWEQYAPSLAYRRDCD